MNSYACVYGQADYAIPIPPFDGMARYRYVPACTHDPDVDTLISGNIHKYTAWIVGFHKDMRARFPGEPPTCPPDRPVVRGVAADAHTARVTHQRRTLVAPCHRARIRCVQALPHMAQAGGDDG